MAAGLRSAPFNPVIGTCPCATSAPARYAVLPPWAAIKLSLPGYPIPKHSFTAVTVAERWLLLRSASGASCPEFRLEWAGGPWSFYISAPFCKQTVRATGLFGPPRAMKSSFCSATTLSGSATLPFVISTEAQRSGEISVWMRFPGSVFLAERAARCLAENEETQRCAPKAHPIPGLSS